MRRAGSGDVAENDARAEERLTSRQFRQTRGSLRQSPEMAAAWGRDDDHVDGRDRGGGRRWMRGERELEKSRTGSIKSSRGKMPGLIPNF